MMLLRPNRTKIIPKFLLHHILSPSVREDQLFSNYIGTASPRVNIGALRKFKFYVPHLDQQASIAARLDALCAQITAAQHTQSETAAELDALLPSILSQAFAGKL